MNRIMKTLLKSLSTYLIWLSSDGIIINIFSDVILRY